MTNILAEKSIGELSPLLKKKEISPVDIVESIFLQINKKNDILNAYLDVYEKEAYNDARDMEHEIVNGQYRGPLHGIPIGLKDNLYMKDKRTTIGSKIYENFKPAFDATVVKKLKEQGVIFTGKLNLDEFAYGVTTENPHYGTSRNPWNPEKITGGSSGGSVSAVSANMSIASIGSETGGSLRAPSSFCGLVSIKPTYGRVSKYGCYPLAPSLDHVGPITKTVEDTAVLLQGIAGYDSNDSSTSKKSVGNYLEALEKEIKGTVIGINEDYFFNDIDASIKKGVMDTIFQLEGQGAKIELVNLKEIHKAREAYAIILAAEASKVHDENIKSNQELFGEGIRSELLYGQTISAVDYLHAKQIRVLVQNEFQELFQKVDVLISPTVPFVAPSVGKEYVDLNTRKVSFADNVSRLIRPTTLIGIPAMTVPCGLKDKLPYGIQILGAPFQEEKMITLAQQIENMNLLNKNIKG